MSYVCRVCVSVCVFAVCVCAVCVCVSQALLAYSNPRDFVSDTAMTIRGIALIATRTIRDGEEVLQNYRLNPYVPRPVWYVPYDIEEEKRRWTKFSLSNLF